MDMQQRYESAAAFYRACSKKCVLNERPEIHFIKDSANFWYCADVWQREQEGERKASKAYILYDFACNQKVPLFDRKKLMSALEPYLPQPLDEEQELPLENISFEGKNHLYFTVRDRVGEFCYDTEADSLTRLEFALHDPEEVTSPDHKQSVLIHEHNLFLRDNRTGVEKQMSFDGCQDIDWGRRFLSTSDLFLNEKLSKQKPAVVWSPNGRYFLTYRTDRRLLGTLGLVQSVPKKGGNRPNHPEYRYAIPGDEHIL